MTVTIGADPGKSGAFACIIDGELYAVDDMPVIGKLVNAPQVAALLREYSQAALATPTVVIEDTHAMPTDSRAGAHSFGRSKGVVEGVVACLGWPVLYVTPARWKADLGLRRDKDASRQLATNTWPSWSQSFARVKDDGRAEAALIALWGTRRAA